MTGAILEAVGPAALTTDPLGLAVRVPRDPAAQRHRLGPSRRQTTDIQRVQMASSHRHRPLDREEAGTVHGAE